MYSNSPPSPLSDELNLINFLSNESENGQSILQLDGNQSFISSQFSDNESNSSLNTTYVTDDEVDPQPIPANLIFTANHIPGQPAKLDVQISSNKQQSSRLPLCMMLNARSLYNKVNNFRTLLHQIGPDIVLVSETWERRRQSLNQLLFLLITRPYPTVGKKLATIGSQGVAVLLCTATITGLM